MTDGHDHTAPEVPSASGAAAEAAMASGAAVMLDIGGDIGAVIVYLGDQTVGEELYIRPAGDPAGRFHTGIHDRVIDGASVRVSVFPECREGTYELLDRQGAPFATVDAVGAEVRTFDLR